MKNLKFWSLLMALVFGLSFGVTSCGDDDDDESSSSSSTSYDDSAISAGESFYEAYEEGNYVNCIAPVTSYITNRSDASYNASFWVGVAAAKYDCEDNLTKAEGYVDQLGELKDMLGDGVSTTDVTTILTNLAAKLSTNTSSSAE